MKRAVNILEERAEAAPGSGVLTPADIRALAESDFEHRVGEYTLDPQEQARYRVFGEQVFHRVFAKARTISDVRTAFDRVDTSHMGRAMRLAYRSIESVIEPVGWQQVASNRAASVEAMKTPEPRKAPEPKAAPKKRYRGNSFIRNLWDLPPEVRQMVGRAPSGAISSKDFFSHYGRRYQVDAIESAMGALDEAAWPPSDHPVRVEWNGMSISGAYYRTKSFRQNETQLRMDAPSASRFTEYMEELTASHTKAAVAGGSINMGDWQFASAHLLDKGESRGVVERAAKHVRAAYHEARKDPDNVLADGSVRTPLGGHEVVLRTTGGSREQLLVRRDHVDAFDEWFCENQRIFAGYVGSSKARELQESGRS